MNCTNAQSLLFRKVDSELSDSENMELDTHLSKCASCRREYALLMLPHRIVQAIPLFVPSSFFYQKLKMRIEAETLKIAEWQSFRRLFQSLVPTLAGIALALLSVFAYLQIYGPQTDPYQKYYEAFYSEVQPHRMLTTEQEDITYEGVLSALAER